jgi:hypothetical protein
MPQKPRDLSLYYCSLQMGICEKPVDLVIMRIACVIPAHPMLTATFIVNEMIEAQEAGHEVVIVPLHSPRLPQCAAKLLNSYGRQPSCQLPY